MNSYSGLVARILKNSYLAEHINKYVDEDALNLISSDWKTRLQNNMIFQDYQTNKNVWNPTSSSIDYNFEESKIKRFNIILVGECRFAKNVKPANKPAVFVYNMEPLMEIVKALTSDLGSSIIYSPESKFNFKRCNVLCCNDCFDAYQKFSNYGYKFNAFTDPCISETKIFDGKKIQHRFISTIEQAFPQSFLAILHLNINVRYYYQDNDKRTLHRIGGQVTEIIAFNEDKLNAPISIDLGDLAPIQIPEKPISKNDLEAGNSSEDTMPKDFEFETTAEIKNNASRKRKFGQFSKRKEPFVEEDVFKLHDDNISKKNRIEESNILLFGDETCDDLDMDHQLEKSGQNQIEESSILLFEEEEDLLNDLNDN